VIRAVIFDIGGALDLEYAFEAAIDEDIRAELQHAGIDVSDEAWLAAELRAIESFAPNLYRSVVWSLTEGADLTAKSIYAHVEERGHERDLFELRPGIDATLRALKARGLKLGLAANQPMRAIVQLEQHGIGHYFLNQGISAVYGFRKPDPRLFLRACEDLGVEPSECIMVGDRIDNDIVPAKLLGMRTIRIRTGRHRDQQPRSWDEQPDREVDDAEGILRAAIELVEEGVDHSC
jgi:HAD superfamily hydrolase (TIGR01662 family)